MADSDSDSGPDMQLGDAYDQEGQPFDEARGEPEPEPGFNIRAMHERVDKHALDHTLNNFNNTQIIGQFYHFARADLPANAVRHDNPAHFMHHNGSYSSVMETERATNQVSPINISWREAIMDSLGQGQPPAQAQPQDEGMG